MNFRYEVTFQPMGGNEGKYREWKVMDVIATKNMPVSV